MDSVMNLRVPWSPSRRRSTRFALQSARTETAALVTQARVALAQQQELVRIAEITDSDDDRLLADAARARCRDQLSAIGNAVGALPKLERRMAAAWDHAAVMTWWYRSSDHQGWAPIEAQVAQVIARLPDGIDTDTALAVIDAASHRCEYELKHRRKAAEQSPSMPDEPKTITQRQLVRLLRADLTGAGLEGFMSSSARGREAERHFVPWLSEATAELAHPQSQERLDEIITRWRELRTQFFWHLSDKRDPTQVRVV